MKDYYKILNLNHKAKVLDIRKSYRELALKLHPDVNTSETAEEEFIEINEAYQVLKNPSKKKNYDNLYVVRVLNKKSNNRYEFREKRWESKVYDSASKGVYKGNIYSRKSVQEMDIAIKIKNFFRMIFYILIWFIGLYIAIMNPFNTSDDAYDDYEMQYDENDILDGFLDDLFK